MSDECGTCRCCQVWERRWRHLMRRITALTVDLVVQTVLAEAGGHRPEPRRPLPPDGATAVVYGHGRRAATTVQTGELL